MLPYSVLLVFLSQQIRINPDQISIANFNQLIRSLYKIYIQNLCFDIGMQIVHFYLDFKKRPFRFKNLKM